MRDLENAAGDNETVNDGGGCNVHYTSGYPTTIVRMRASQADAQKHPILCAVATAVAVG